MSDARQLDERVAEWLRHAAQVLLRIDAAGVTRAAQALTKVRDRGGVVYAAGNGGSASTASHLCVDLQKPARKAGSGGMRAVCLADNVGLITAWGNDAAFEDVFAEQLEILAQPGDAVVIFSVSGSSPNLLALLDVARKKGAVSIGLLGGDGGRAAPQLDHPIIVPSDDYGWVESAHLVLEHVLAYALRSAPVLRVGDPSSAAHSTG